MTLECGYDQRGLTDGGEHEAREPFERQSDISGEVPQIRTRRDEQCVDAA
jgi:hypothetical protein